MKGATAVVAMVLMFLVVIGGTVMFFSYIRGLQTNIISESEKQMVELDIPPKLMNLICYNGYGYMDLSLSQGQKTVSGQALYSVDLDTGKRVAEGFVDMNITGTGRVYLPYFFESDERYFVTLSGKRWKISEYCRPINDPHKVLHLTFDETTGLVANDASDYDNDGVVVGATWTEGHLSGALEFNGSNVYVVVPDSESLNISKNITISAWIYPYNLSSYSHYIVSKGRDCCDSPGKGGYNLDFVVGAFDANIWISPSKTQVRTLGTTLSLNTWQHVVMVFDGQYLRKYRDAVPKGSASAASDTIQLSTLDVTIGVLAYSYPTYHPFNGTIDDVRIYNRAFSLQEIETLYQASVGGAQ
ncbi:MAG: LamG domain-containing protein [Candidatus Altiarchaeota archaeon]|nr:LamG domain-containing protein [Candidatus Altiarchaeota archaeon]